MCMCVFAQSPGYLEASASAAVEQLALRALSVAGVVQEGLNLGRKSIRYAGLTATFDLYTPLTDKLSYTNLNGKSPGAGIYKDVCGYLDSLNSY